MYVVHVYHIPVPIIAISIWLYLGGIWVVKVVKVYNQIELQSH